MLLAKDFIETAEGLVFALVENGTEHNKALCFLRYVKTVDGWQKYGTESANQLLRQKYPQYLYYSELKDAHLHAVEVSKVVNHYSAKARLNTLLNKDHNRFFPVESDLIELCRLYEELDFDVAGLGVTGSLLIGAQNPKSDIDLVCYHRADFHRLRHMTRQLIDSGQLKVLNASDWQQSYQRRDCDLSLQEYIYHEQRKYNKAVINQRKFDLNLVVPEVASDHKVYKKLAKVKLIVQVIDDNYAFDYPARFKINHQTIEAVVSYTATYTGQALTGEWIEVSGLLEQDNDGRQRIVVGSTREAEGEYIKVMESDV